jgi:hypothetical protein
MAAVTQRIGSYLGGVSKQSDDKKLPGQVRECYNGYPDITYGLTKRPGFKHIANLGTGTSLDDAKWLYIDRDDDEEYIVAFAGNTVSAWNAQTGVQCTITYGTGAQSYLNGNKNNYKLLNIQDTTIVINNSTTVTALPAPSYVPKSVAVLELFDIPLSTNYTVTIEGQTFNTTSGVSATYDSVLTALKNGIDAFNISGLVVTKRRSSLDLVRTVGGTPTAFTITASGGSAADKLKVIQDQVDNVSRLPSESFQGNTLKILNTDSDSDSYYAQFVADDGSGGPGFWEETIAPGVSAGFDDSTMPHELVNTGLNTFTFRKISYSNRLVGDQISNADPSFVGEKITGGFIYGNRIGFLSKDNVSLSQAGDFYNFYFATAQTVVDSDPVDVNCSSLETTTLFAAVSKPQGVVLFSGKQQFILSSESGVLTPSLALVNTLSNYEMDPNIDPVDNGPYFNFVNKTPSYTRVFSMVTRGNDENPQVLNVGKIVRDWISPNITDIAASPDSQILCLYGQSLNEVFINRFYNDGEKNLLEAWISWLMPGNVQFMGLNRDNFYAVTKQANQFVLSVTSLSQSPEDAIIVSGEGSRINPCIDFYASPSSVVYDSANDRTKCYLPYNNVPDLKTVLIVKGNTHTAGFSQSGYTLTPERGTDNTGDFFSIPNQDLTSISSNLIVGFRYDFDVELPFVYYRPDENVTDFTASLVISRMRFTLGMSGNMSFRIKRKGSVPKTLSFTGDGTTTQFNWNPNEFKYENVSEVSVSVNGALTSDTEYSFIGNSGVQFNSAPAAGDEIVVKVLDYIVINSVAYANDYLANDVPLSDYSVVTVPIYQRSDNFTMRLFNDSPFPVAINSMMWEGQYSQRYYRRA